MRRVAADGSGWPFACRTNRPNPSVRQQVSTQGGGPELTLSLPQAVVETSRAAFKSSIHVSHRSLLSLTVRRPQGSVRQLVVRPPSTVRGKSAVTEDERTEDERDSDKAAWRHRTPELNIVSHGVNVSRDPPELPVHISAGRAAGLRRPGWATLAIGDRSPRCDTYARLC